AQARLGRCARPPEPRRRWQRRRRRRQVPLAPVTPVLGGNRRRRRRRPVEVAPALLRLGVDPRLVAGELRVRLERVVDELVDALLLIAGHALERRPQRVVTGALAHALSTE